MGLAAAGSAAHAQNLPQPPVIAAKNCLVLDLVSNRILFSKGPDVRRPVASTQKLLAALVVAESGMLDRPTVIHADDTKMEPTKLYLKPGERVTIRTLFNAMLIKSCNDAAQAAGRAVAGSPARFAAMMNQRAARLGMTNSRFVNAHGLPAEGQYSTARDMARAARAAYMNASIRGVVGRYELPVTRGDGRVSMLRNTNALINPNSSYHYANCTGMKTGYTRATGKCLISTAVHRGRTVLCVLLGAHAGKPSVQAWMESRALLQWALGV
jgi:serine-type D-Ala-D-Ala carboxypeptidase (penicillin-binding protein 5/6)